MTKRMFSKFTTIIQQAVDALAPNLSLQDDFVYHWKAITNYFIDNKNDKKPIEQTNIPSHLDQMLQILQGEEEGCESGSTGPCMEYMLQHKLLETLYTLARTDFPPGMKQTVLVFFTKLLSRIKQPLLPHINVHKAVHRLIRICGEVKAGPAENEEIHFLCTVCSKLAADPYLVNFFLDYNKASIAMAKIIVEEYKLLQSKLARPLTQRPVIAYKKNKSLKDILYNKASIAMAKIIVEEYKLLQSKLARPLTQRPVIAYKKNKSLKDILIKKKGNGEVIEKAAPVSIGNKSEFSLINSLLSLSQSADGRVAVKACEGLMLCCCMPEQAAAARLIHHTNFCQSVTDRLVMLYKKLPKTLDPIDLESVQAKWGLDVNTELGDSQSFPGKRNVISFLSWLDYCDQLISMAFPDVASALALYIRTHFLEAVIQPALMQASETGAILATCYFCRCLRTVCSPLLLHEFVSFVLGVQSFPEPDTEECCKLRQVLIDRCNHLSEKLSIATLKLFDTLLQKEDSHIIHNLVLRNLLGRGYYRSIQPADVPNGPGVDDNQTEETEETTQNSSTTPSPAQDSSKEEPLKTETSPPGKTEVHKIINSFLMLVPEELKSCSQTTDGDYDVYLRDAHRQYADMSGVCKPWGWPSSPVTDTIYITPDYHEGSFLHMLLEKFQKLLNQPYAVNLQVTSVLSRLCLIPHPNLHEFLLDPFLPVKDGVRTPYSILKKIIGEVKQKTVNDGDFTGKLKSMRQELMGVETVLNNLRRQVSYKPSAEDAVMLEAVIVVEEFCKELAAIAFVKHHATVTSSSA